MIPSAKGPPQFRVGKPEIPAADIHGDLPGQHQPGMAFVTCEIVGMQPALPGHGLHDIPVILTTGSRAAQQSFHILIRRRLFPQAAQGA